MSDERWEHEEDAKQEDEKKLYEPFWVCWGKPVTDEEFVERARKRSTRSKHLKTLLLVIHSGIVCFILFFGDRVVKLIAGMLNVQAGLAANPNIARDVVLLGIGLGSGVGILLTHSIMTIMELLLGDRLTDLLLKYHDLAQHTRDNPLDQD